METKKRVDKVEKVLPEYNEGALKSGKAPAGKVTRQQAVIIRLNEVGLRIKSKQ